VVPGVKRPAREVEELFVVDKVERVAVSEELRLKVCRASSLNQPDSCDHSLTQLIPMTVF
jgi:hypothetical protein